MQGNGYVKRGNDMGAAGRANILAASSCYSVLSAV